MFSKRSIERLAGALLVASVVVFLGHAVAYAADLSRTLILCIFMYGVLVILSAMALYLTFRPHERTLALFSAFGLAAHGLFIVLFCSLSLAQLAFAQEFAVTEGAEADAVAAAANAFEMTAARILASGYVFLGLGLVSLGVLIVWSGAVARWVGWLGIVGGVLGFLSQLAVLFDVVVGGLASILTGITLLTALGFLLILGVRLVVWETREATAGKPQRGE